MNISTNIFVQRIAFSLCECYIQKTHKFRMLTYAYFLNFSTTELPHNLAKLKKQIDVCHNIGHLDKPKIKTRNTSRHYIQQCTLYTKALSLLFPPAPAVHKVPSID